MNWANEIDGNREFFVLLVKPAGVDVANKLILGLRRAGYEVGWDVAPAEVPAVKVDEAP